MLAALPLALLRPWARMKNKNRLINRPMRVRPAAKARPSPCSLASYPLLLSPCSLRPCPSFFRFPLLFDLLIPLGAPASTEHKEQPLEWTLTPPTGAAVQPVRRPVTRAKRSTPMATCYTFSAHCAIWPAGVPSQWLITSSQGSST